MRMTAPTTGGCASSPCRATRSWTRPILSPSESKIGRCRKVERWRISVMTSLYNLPRLPPHSRTFHGKRVNEAQAPRNNEVLSVLRLGRNETREHTRDKVHVVIADP